MLIGIFSFINAALFCLNKCIVVKCFLLSKELRSTKDLNVVPLTFMLILKHRIEQLLTIDMRLKLFKMH